MARAMWRGAIQFGLVTIPVKLYLATEPRAGLSFNLLHKECLNRIQMKTHCPIHGEIARSDTVRGFEWSKGQYVVIEEGDLESVPLKTVRSIEINLFVDAQREGHGANCCTWADGRATDVESGYSARRDLGAVQTLPQRSIRRGPSRSRPRARRRRRAPLARARPRQGLS